jgi:hypothetical protein
MGQQSGCAFAWLGGEPAPRKGAMRRVKACVRLFLVWSSIPAVARLYRIVYSLLIALAVRVLRSSPGAVAVYLTRGCGKQEILPGLSDIDLLVIVSGGAPKRERVERSFHTLQTLSAGLIPYHPSFVMTPEELRYRWDSIPYWRYRLQEGKANWRLLHGSDVRPMLPEMSDIERKTSCAAEMNYWWVQFARFVMHGGTYADDNVMRNSICYKAVAEVLNARRAMLTGEYCYSKTDALRRENSELARRLLKNASHRHLGRDRELEDATYRFLVESLCDMWGRFANDPCLDVYPEVRQSLDLSGDEAGEESIDRELERRIVSRWSAGGREIRVVRSAFWPVEDRLMIMNVLRSALPSLDELEHLLRSREHERSTGRGRLYVFLKAGAVAFPLTPDMPRDFHRGVLTAATAPDVFLQLGEDRVFWTSHSKWYLTDWQRNRQWPDLCPLKRRQLETIARGSAGNHVVYPLTDAAIMKMASGW